MKKYSLHLLFILVIFCQFFSSLALDQKDFVKNTTGPAFDKILKKNKVNEEHLSVIITREEKGKQDIVLSVGAQKVLIPASVTKLITAAAVLDQLPQDIKFKTQLLADKSNIKDSVLKGPLYFKGGGDPSFVSENLWYLVNIFIRSGVKKIEGDLIVDDTLFDSVRYDLSREASRVDRAYDAPVGALSFNWNSVNVFVRPSSETKPQIFLDPQNDFTTLTNKANMSSKTALMVDRTEIKNRNQIVVSGQMGRNASEQTIFKNITEPDLWSGENLKSFLAQRGVIVQGQVKRGSVPSSAEIVAEYESKNISLILADMNKFSNNYIAEMLTKHLGLLVAKPGTISNGMKRINEYLKNINAPADQYVMVNPSGLTRENRLSSYVLWQVLSEIKKDFRHYPEFSLSLPIGGFDGTLKRRFKSTSAEGWVRAKTGYLNKVVSLAGYAGRKDGALLTFSLIYNGPVDEAQVRNCFDDLLIEALR